MSYIKKNLSTASSILKSKFNSKFSVVSDEQSDEQRNEPSDEDESVVLEDNTLKNNTFKRPKTLGLVAGYNRTNEGVGVGSSGGSSGGIGSDMLSGTKSITTQWWFWLLILIAIIIFTLVLMWIFNPVEPKTSGVELNASLKSPYNSALPSQSTTLPSNVSSVSLASSNVPITSAAPVLPSPSAKLVSPTLNV